MTKSIKKFVLCVCALLLALTAVGIVSTTTNKVHASSIKDTNVLYNSVEKIIKIDDRKICDITEIITVTYRQPGINVGLSRNVSRVNKITRKVNGKKYVNTTVNKLTLVSLTMDDAEEYHFVEQKGDYYYINTGADGDYKQGKHVYKINYLYDMGEDFISDFDDFTFDIMDYGFRGSVRAFSASITLPKDFLNGKDISQVLSFRTNNMEDIGAEALNMEYDPNTYTIKCKYDNVIPSQTGFTMQLIMPNKYFRTNYTPNVMYKVVLAFFIGAVVSVAIIVICKNYVKRGVIVPEFMPPKGCSALDIARAYRGKVLSKDMAALIIEWAAKGYIKIEIISKRHIILTKLKDIDKSEHSAERNYFNHMFARGETKFDTKKERRRSNSALGTAGQRLVERRPGQLKRLVITRVAIHAVTLLPLVLYLIWAHGIGVSPVFPIPILLLFPFIALMVFIYAPIPLWFKIIWCGGFGGVPLGASGIVFSTVYDVYSLGWLCVALFLAGGVVGRFIRDIAPQDLANRDKVLGFKMFLQKAELTQLEALVEQDPDYYYNILPYCYVLGLTKKMEKKFETLHLPQPAYVEGDGLGSASHMFGCIHSATSSVGGMSGSSGSGGGGGGGGGSSGGGGGGGGCGGR